MLTEEKSDNISDWERHLNRKGWCVGLWRQTYEARDNVKLLEGFSTHEKHQGTLLLVKNTATWYLDFYKASCLT